jgi:hypothetical protein
MVMPDTFSRAFSKGGGGTVPLVQIPGMPDPQVTIRQRSMYSKLRSQANRVPTAKPQTAKTMNG